MVVNYKGTYTERDTEHSLKNESTLKTSFGAKPNVLQFCPLSNFYVVNVIQPLRTLLMFNRFIHMIKVLARHKSIGST